MNYTFDQNLKPTTFNPCVYWTDGFTDKELQYIIDYCDGLELSQATINDDHMYSDVRKTKISWIHPDPKSNKFIDKIHEYSVKMNQEFYNYDVNSFEPLQYTVYDENGSYFDYHLDMSNTPTYHQRKLTCILFLSDPSEYEGGQFLIKTGTKDAVIEQKKGLLIMMPSFIMHQKKQLFAIPSFSN